MCETPRLSRPPINCDPYINDVLDFSEKNIQISVAHIEGHISNEESIGGGVDGATRCRIGRTAGVVAAPNGVLDAEAAALEVLEVI